MGLEAILRKSSYGIEDLRQNPPDPKVRWVLLFVRTEVTLFVSSANLLKASPLFIDDWLEPFV